MPAIHHATAKRAAALGLSLIVVDDFIAARSGEHVVCTGLVAKDVLVDAEKAIANGWTPPVEPAQDDPRWRTSIVKPKYRRVYAPKGECCGDTIAAELKAYLTYVDEETGEESLDLRLLRRFADANDCWVDTYAKLNPGQQRMNIGNRLRAKVRKGHVVAWVE